MLCLILDHLSSFLILKGAFMLESKFQARLIKKLKETYPDAFIKKTDPSDLKGFPDILILKDSKWALLECKKEKDAHKQPLQDYYVNKANEMSFARFIYPENEEEVLHELQQALES